MAVDKGAEGGVVIVELDVAVDGEGDDELFEVGEVVDKGRKLPKGHGPRISISRDLSVCRTELIAVARVDDEEEKGG